MTVWYAQKSGNISANDVFFDAPSGGNAKDVSAESDGTIILSANSYTIAIDEDVTALRLSTADEDAGGAGVAGGGFALSGNTAVAITADITAGTTACLTSTHTGTGVNAVTINGNVTGGSAYAAYGAYNSSTGTITINGNVTGGSGQSAMGARHNGTGTLTINGNVTGGSATNAYGAWNQTTGVLTITGAVTGGSGRDANGAWNNSTGTLTINGTVAASSTARAFGVYNNSTGVITVIGSLVDSATCGAYYGPIYWQPVAGVHYHKVFHSAGAARYYSPSPADSDVRFGTFAGFSPSGVSYSGILALPAVANVRDGIFYDAYGTQEGTLQIPAEADVKAGVGYGTNGTEFTGTLAAGGGGVPLIGPGGLVG